MKISIEIEPIESKRQEILDLPKQLRKALLNIVEEIMRHLVERSRLNAPIKTGDLRGSLMYEKPRLVASGVIESGIGSDLPYALRWHEEPFNLGPISARQPSTPEGGVGNKYVTRAADYRRKQYAEIIMEAVLLALLKHKDKVPIDTRSAD